jgi:hypothetical protein
MKTKNLLLVLGSVFLFSLGCSNEVGNEQLIPDSALKGQSDSDQEIEKEGVDIKLNGTKWKLAGIVDLETNTLTELEPKDCEECYTLTFDTDTTLSALSISRKVYIDLNQYPRNIEAMLHIQSHNDGEKFCDAILAVEAYSTTSKELKLFYNDLYDEGKKYLLFKIIE